MTSMQPKHKVNLGSARARAIISLILVAVLVPSCLFAGYSYAQSSTLSTTTISGGSYPGAPSYTVFLENGVTYAKDAYGAIQSSSSDASIVIQYALTHGDKVYLREGVYSACNLVLKNGNSLEGEVTGYYQDGYYLHPILGSVIKQNANGNVLSFSTSTLYTSGNLLLRNLQIDGDLRGHSGNAINLVNATLSNIENVNVLNINGSAVYYSNVFSSHIDHMINSNCGVYAYAPTMYLGGLQYIGSQNILVNDLQMSYSNYIDLHIYGSQVTVNNLVSDHQAAPAAPFEHIFLEAGSDRITVNNADLRNGNAGGSTVVNNKATSSLWTNLQIRFAAGSCFTNGAANITAQISNAYFMGTDISNSALVGFDVQGGLIQVTNYVYRYMTTSNQTSGAGVFQDSNIFDNTYVGYP